MKKLMLIIAMLFICTSCSNGNNSSSSKSENESTSTPTSETSAQTTVSTESTTANITTTEKKEEDKTLDINRFDTAKPIISLTFDDGPNTTTTPKVLETLEKYDIVATFFVIGTNINDSSGKVMKQAFDMGCEIANHSNTHSNLSKLELDKVFEELKITSDKVESIIGQPTAVFRPPYIAVSQEMYDNIDMPIICGIGSDDWDSSVSVEDRATPIIKNIKDGDIILLHDFQGNQKTVDALDIIIPALLAQGYQFATVSELFAVKEIEPQKNILYTNVMQKGKWG